MAIIKMFEDVLIFFLKPLFFTDWNKTVTFLKTRCLKMHVSYDYVMLLNKTSLGNTLQ